jgi:hypothetical protein
VHEDLLCANSAFFKSRLQKTRKAIDGECPICHDDMDAMTDDVTFCRAKCGQNMHEKCMEQWSDTRPAPATCPMCRKSWKQKAEDLIALDEDLDPEAIQLYIDWLYSGTLQIDETISRAAAEYDL